MLLNEINPIFLTNSTQRNEINKLIDLFPKEFRNIDCDAIKVKLFKKTVQTFAGNSTCTIEKNMNDDKSFNILLRKSSNEGIVTLNIKNDRIIFSNGYNYQHKDVSVISNFHTRLVYKEIGASGSFKKEIFSDSFFEPLKSNRINGVSTYRIKSEIESSYKLFLEETDSIEIERTERKTYYSKYKDHLGESILKRKYSRFESDKNLIMVEDYNNDNDVYVAYQKNNDILDNAELVKSMIKRINIDDVQLFYADDSKLESIIKADNKYLIALEKLNNNAPKQKVLKKSE